MMDLAAGTICLVRYPFTDQAAAKLRPALVAGSDNPLFLALTDADGGQAGLNVTFVQIVGHAEAGIYNIVVDPQVPEFQGTRLERVSTIRCWNINTIHRGLVERVLGRLPASTMAEVRQMLAARLQLASPGA